MAQEQFQMMQMGLSEVKDALMSGTPDLVSTQYLMIAVVNAVQGLERRLEFQRNRIADLDRMACEE